MAKRWPFLIPVVIVAGLLAIFGVRLAEVSQGDDPRLLPSVLLNTPFPDMNLAPLPGREKPGLITADLKGRVSLVNVWGSWCVACLAEHDMLMNIKSENLAPVHGIDWRDTPERGLAWLAQHGDPYENVGLDPRSVAAIALGVTGAPETFVVDQAGVIRYKHIGPITPEDWRNKFKPLIASLQK